METNSGGYALPLITVVFVDEDYQTKGLMILGSCGGVIRSSGPLAGTAYYFDNEGNAALVCEAPPSDWKDAIETMAF